MKKMIIGVIIVVLLFGFFGCGETAGASNFSGQSMNETSGSTGNQDFEVICNYPKMVSGNRGHTIYYLEEDGTLYGWGKNYYYLLNLPIPEYYYSYKPIVLATDVADVVNNLFTTYMLKKDGTLWVLGYYPHAEDGSDYASAWTEIARDIKQLCGGGTGRNISSVLKQDGSMYLLGSTYGGNVSGVQPSVEIDEFKLRPVDTDVDKLGGIHSDVYGDTIESQSQVNVGLRYTAGYFKDGAYWQAIENKDGSFTLQKLVDGNIAQVPLVGRFDFYIDIDGNLKSVKENKIIAENIISFLTLTGEKRCLFVTADHKLWEIGETTLPIDGEYTVYEEPHLIQEDVEKVYGASDTLCMEYYILKTDGTLWCWGSNMYLLGNGTVSVEIARGNEKVPEATTVQDNCTEITQVLNINHVKSFCYSSFAKVAVTKSGERYVWGSNVYYRAYTDGTSEKDSPSAEYDEDPSTRPSSKQITKEDILLVPTTWTEAFAKYGYEN